MLEMLGHIEETIDPRAAGDAVRSGEIISLPNHLHDGGAPVEGEQ